MKLAAVRDLSSLDTLRLCPSSFCHVFRKIMKTIASHDWYRVSQYNRFLHLNFTFRSRSAASPSAIVPSLPTVSIFSFSVKLHPSTLAHQFLTHSISTPSHACQLTAFVLPKLCFNLPSPRCTRPRVHPSFPLRPSSHPLNHFPLFLIRQPLSPFPSIAVIYLNKPIPASVVIIP